MEGFPSERNPPFRGEERGVQSVGILPIAKSTLFQNTVQKPILAEFEGWSLVGHGEAYDDCGMFGWKGCLNYHNHHARLDNPDCEGKVFVKGFRRSCGRAECPICFEKWAVKQAVRATNRLKNYKGGYRKAIHVTVSVPEKHYSLEYPNLRKKVMKLLKEIGFIGGTLIPHPFREDVRGWYLSWHFHAVGYGWIEHTKEVYEKTGYVVKNIGIRKTVRGTLSYQLSHAGYNKNYHVLTWFGELAYNKLKVEEDLDDKEVCPDCGERLILVRYMGVDRPPPEVESEFYVDPKGWISKN